MSTTTPVIAGLNQYAVECVNEAKRDLRHINPLASLIHGANKKWWVDKDGNPLNRNKGELLMLMVSEIAEAMEGVRKGIPDDKLPHRSMEEVELADLFIRALDYAGAHNLDLAGAIAEKLQYNLTRIDHTHEARAAQGGKKF